MKRTDLVFLLLILTSFRSFKKLQEPADKKATEEIVFKDIREENIYISE